VGHLQLPATSLASPGQAGNDASQSLLDLGRRDYRMVLAVLAHPVMMVRVADEAGTLTAGLLASAPYAGLGSGASRRGSG
jgi:hypothetical protein